MPDKKKIPQDILDDINSDQNDVHVSSLSDAIGAIESAGKYDSINNNSSAVGKHQFLWNKWGDQIKQITGVKSKEEFRHNPSAQEEFFNYYEQNSMIPAVSELKKFNKDGYSDDQLKKLYHFKGEEGAKEWLTSKEDNTTENNTSIDNYIGAPQKSKTEIPQSIIDDINSDTGNDPQKKSPSESGLGTNSPTSQGGLSANNQQDGVSATLNQTDPVSGLPVMNTQQNFDTPILKQPLPPTRPLQQSSVTKEPVMGKTDNATTVLTNDIVDNAANLPKEYTTNMQNIPFTQPGNIVHDITDPHGNAEMTAGYLQTRLAQLEKERIQDRQRAMSDMQNNPSADMGALGKVDADYFEKQKALRESASHLVDLQLANKAYADGHMDPVLMGIEKQKLLGDKKAIQDEIDYKASKPLDPNSKYAYQSIGLNALQSAKNSAMAGGRGAIAEHFGDKSDDPEARLEKDNAEVIKNQRVQRIANRIYKDENPIHGTLFSRESVTQEELEDAAKKEGLTKAQIKNISPDEIPRSAGLLNQVAQGFVNTAGGSLYEGGMRALAGLGIADQDAVDKRFHPGWESEGGMGSLFTGKTPQAQGQISLDNPRGIVGAMSKGVGDIAGFLAGGEVGSELLQGSKIVNGADKANKISNFATAAVQSYNSAAQKAPEVVGDAPEDEGKRQLYSMVNGIIGGGVMMIDPKADIARDILGETKAGQSLINTIKKDGIEGLTKPAFQSKITQVLKETANHLGMQVAIPAVQTMAENMTDMVFDPKKDHGLSDNVAQAAISGGIGMFIPSLLSGITHSRNQTKLNKSILWDAAQNPTEYLKQAHDLYSDGKISRDELLQVTNGLSEAAKIVNNDIPEHSVANDKELTQTQKQDYAWNLLKEKTLQGQLEKLPEGEVTQRKVLSQKLKELDAERTDILNKAGDTPEGAKPRPNTISEDTTPGETPADIASEYKEVLADKYGKDDEITPADKNHLDRISSEGEVAVKHELSFYEHALESEKGKEAPDEHTIQNIQSHIDEVKPFVERIENSGEQKNIEEDINKSKEHVSLISTEDNSSQTKNETNEKSNEDHASVRQDANDGQRQDAEGSAKEDSKVGNEGRPSGQLSEGENDLKESGGAAKEQQPPEPVSVKKKRRKIIIDDESEDAEPSEAQAKQIPHTQHEDFAAWRQGTEEGKPKSDREQAIKNAPNDQKIGGEESFNDFKDRIHGAWDKLKSEGKDDTLFIAHSGVMKMIEAANEHGWDDADKLREAYNGKSEPPVGKIITEQGDHGDIHITRHGETEDNADGLLRTKDVELTDKGREQAKDIIPAKLAEQDIRPQEIVSSDLPRATETAKIVKEEIAEENQENTNEGATKIKNESAELKDNADAEAAQSSKENTRLKEIELDLQRQHASQKLEGQKRQAAEKAGDIPAVNKANENWYKKKEKIDKLNEEREQLIARKEKEERNQEIKSRYNKVADNLEARYARNKKNHEGVALSSIIGLSTKIGDHVADFVVARVAEGIRALGNVHIAIDRAIRLAKEKFGDEASELSYRDNEAIRDHVINLGIDSSIQQREPALPIDQEEYAKDLLADIQGGMAYEDAVKELREEIFENRKGEAVSEHVGEKAKAAILNYIDWHIQDKYTHRQENNYKASQSRNPYSKWDLTDRGLFSEYLGAKTTKSIVGEEGYKDSEAEKKNMVTVKGMTEDANSFVNLYKDNTRPTSEWATEALAHIKADKESPQKQVIALSGLHGELQQARIKSETDLAAINKKITATTDPVKLEDLKTERGKLLSEYNKNNSLLADLQNTKKKILSRSSDVLNAGRVDRFISGDALFENYEKAVLPKATVEAKSKAEDVLAKPVEELKPKERKVSDEAKASAERKEKEENATQKKKNVFKRLKDKATEIKTKKQYAKAKTDAEKSFGLNDKGQRMTPQEFLEHIKKLKNPC